MLYIINAAPPWRGAAATYHLHGVVVDQLLGRDAVDLVHEALLVREEVVEPVGEPPAQRDAALVAFVQILHH